MSLSPGFETYNMDRRYNLSHSKCWYFPKAKSCWVMSKAKNLFVTVRKRNLGKVMFLHLSVILFTGRCIPLVDTPLGRHLPKQTPPGRHPLLPGRHPSSPLADNPAFPWQTPLFSPGRHPPSLPPPPQTTTAADGTHHLTLVVATSAILRVWSHLSKSMVIQVPFTMNQQLRAVNIPYGCETSWFLNHLPRWLCLNYWKKDQYLFTTSCFSFSRVTFGVTHLDGQVGVNS